MASRIRAEPTPPACNEGSTDTGARARAGKGACMRESRTWPTSRPSCSATSEIAVSPSCVRSATRSASGARPNAASTRAHTASVSSALASRRIMPPYLRQTQGRAKAAQGRAAEQDIAAVAAGDVAGDREAQAHALGVLIARLVQAGEGSERLLEPVRGDAGAVI